MRYNAALLMITIISPELRGIVPEKQCQKWQNLTYEIEYDRAEVKLENKGIKIFMVLQFVIGYLLPLCVIMIAYLILDHIIQDESLKIIESTRRGAELKITQSSDHLNLILKIIYNAIDKKYNSKVKNKLTKSRTTYSM